MASIFMCLSQRLISKYSSISIALCTQVSQCSLSIPPLYPVSSHILHQPLSFKTTVRNGHVTDSWSLTLYLIKTECCSRPGERQEQTPQ